VTVHPVFAVFFAALATALATGLGALPFLLTRVISKRWMGISNALAAGLMLSASHSLVAEGIEVSAVRTIGGVLMGLGAILIAQHLVRDHVRADPSSLRGADLRKMILMVGVMTAHSFAEGIGVGVSFGGTAELATFISAAVAVHNIPEGLAISLVLVSRGMPVWKAAGWSIFSSLPQPLMAVPAFLFVTSFQQLLPIGLGIAAGAMIWMVFADLLPDALEHVGPETVGTTATLAFAAMLVFQYIVLK
jgi:zinc transporter ZupT